MPLTAEDLAQTKVNLGFVYVDLMSHYRGLLHVLSEKGVIVSEQAEQQISEWIAQHQQDVWREAADRLKEFFDAPGRKSS